MVIIVTKIDYVCTLRACCIHRKTVGLPVVAYRTVEIVFGGGGGVKCSADLRLVIQNIYKHTHTYVHIIILYVHNGIVLYIHST